MFCWLLLKRWTFWCTSHILKMINVYDFIPLVWGRYARWATFHWKHVDSSFSCCKKATETQEGAHRHRWCCSAILQREREHGGYSEGNNGRYYRCRLLFSNHLLVSCPILIMYEELSHQSSSSRSRWWEATYQAVHYTDVPLVLFEPEMHVFTHTVETAEVGGTAYLPVTLWDLHTHKTTYALRQKESCIATWLRE